MCISGMGPVHMNEVACSGFEKSVTECFFNKEALGCSHEEDAAVRCNVPAMGFQQSVSPTRPFSLYPVCTDCTQRLDWP